MENLNNAIVPNELIVGITGNLCYVTYNDGKKINSEKSWAKWSKNSKSPLIVKNKFANGFKIGGVNGRNSSMAANAENLLIEHPLFNKCFEIPLNRFIEIASKTTITNGVIDAEFIMDKSRNILFRDEYEKLVKKHNKEVKTATIQKEKNLINKVKNVDQMPGKIYVDLKTNNKYCYLGTALLDDNIKYIYIRASTVDNIHSEQKVRLRSFNGVKCEFNNYKIIETLKYPTICWVDSRTYENENQYENADDHYYFSDMGYNMRIVASKISMALSDDDRNIYDSFTQSDWAIVDKCYTGTNILNHKTSVNNFKKDYELFKDK